jgi:hypothetical protein
MNNVPRALHIDGLDLFRRRGEAVESGDVEDGVAAGDGTS